MRNAWDGFDQAYTNGVRRLMMDIYAGIARDKSYFIDKTPRYSLIAKEIIQTFPDAHFIVLWRHPLAIAASMFTTSNKSYWFPDEYAIDLHEGIQRLHRTCIEFKDRIFQIRYEDLVTDPILKIESLGNYLGIKDLSAVLKKPLINRNYGRLGDHTGVKKFKSISNKSLNAWVDVYSNFYRTRWAIEYASEKVSKIMEEYDYTIPDQFRHYYKRNIVSGVNDIIQSCIRRRRKITRPVWHRRFINEFKSNNDFTPTFR
jgi:hypothetical protein